MNGSDNMSSKKIYNYIGANSAAIMIEQDRKHWLLKTMKKKQLIDEQTGDVYQGRIDNLGSDIIVESQKLPEVLNTLTYVQFGEGFDDIFEVEPSGFTYNSSLNGLVFARITSINFPYSSSTNHYRIHFRDCEEVYIPFGSSLTSNEVYADKWIKTSTPPVLMLMTSQGVYSIEVPLTFKDVDKYSVLLSIPVDWDTNWFDYYYKTSEGYEHLDDELTEAPPFVPRAFYVKEEVSPSDAVYYYPLNPNIQPFELESDGNGEYHTEGIISNDQLGYPAFWFTTDLTNVGPYIDITNSMNIANKQMAMIGNAGNGSKYNAYMYFGVDGDYNATPDVAPTNTWTLWVMPLGSQRFHDTSSDFNVDLDPTAIGLGNGTDQYYFQLNYHGNYPKIHMVRNDNWEYVNDREYRINLSEFDVNCREHYDTPLIPALRMILDTSLPIGEKTTDVGFVGIRGGSGNTESDIYEKYPYDLNKFDGLPEHLSNPDIDAPPEHMAVYAVHNTPDYIEGDPTTRQTAGVLLDPGKAQHPETQIDWDFYWQSGIRTKDGAINNGIFPEEYRSDLFFIKITDPSYDVYERLRDKGLSTTGMLHCYDEDQNFICRIWAVLSYEGGIYNPIYWNQSTGSMIYCTYYATPLYYMNWLNPKNTKIDGTGFEYIDIRYVIDSSVDGGGAPYDINYYDLGIRFRIYRNLDLTDANYTRGRVYVLSNDSIEYENNKKSLYPKPARTAARICDIPTSIAQLSGMTNIAPTYVVDKDYVRTETSFTEEDKDRLYNINTSRWVRPVHLNQYGQQIPHDNDYVFNSVNELNQIDLVNYNHFRYIENLIPLVDPSDVHVGEITQRGEDYADNDTGFIYVGGFGFQYVVENADEDGRVTRASLSYPDINQDPNNVRKINLSNFNMATDHSGFTTAYGTTPLSPSQGHGLKMTLFIDNYHDILPYAADIYEDLFALVRESDGLWMYQFERQETVGDEYLIRGQWKREIQISQFESSNTGTQYQTTTDAFMASILPRYTDLPVCKYEAKNSPTSMKTVNTASFVQIIDTGKTPISNVNEVYDDQSLPVDLTKFYTDGFAEYTSSDDLDSVVNILKSVNKLRSDCYIAWKSVGSNRIRAAVIYRSFNNLRSNNTETTLPANSLKYQTFVNSNANTTIAWDVPHIGPMVWMFNPNYIYHETYRIDTHTNSFVIDREKMDWTNVDIRVNNTTTTESLFDEDGKLMYNIATNSLYITPGRESYIDHNVIYDQPEFHQILYIGNTQAQIGTSKCITGNWQCIFPRVSGFVFQEGDSLSKKYTLSEMQTLHDINLITDSSHNPHIIDAATDVDVTNKTMLIEDTSGGVFIKVFNEKTQQWEMI